MASSASESRGVTSRSNRKCRCGKIPCQYCSWKAAIVGRRFFGCPDFNKVKKCGCKYFDWVDEPFDSRLSGVLSFLVNSKTIAEEMAVRLDAQVKELSTDLESMIAVNDNLLVSHKMQEEKVKMLETEKGTIDKKIRLLVKIIGLLCAVIIWLVMFYVM